MTTHGSVEIQITAFSTSALHGSGEFRVSAVLPQEKISFQCVGFLSQRSEVCDSQLPCLNKWHFLDHNLQFFSTWTHIANRLKTRAKRLTVAGAVRVPSGVGGLNPGPGLGQGLPAVPCRFHGNRPLKRNVYTRFKNWSSEHNKKSLPFCCISFQLQKSHAVKAEFT